MKKKIFGSLLLLILPLFGFAFEETEGNTYKTADRLFHIARSANKNLVCYDVNIENGELQTKHPIKVYWVDREEHPGKTEGLSYIQRKLAYGYKLVSNEGNTCVCSLSAYPKRPLTISKQEDGSYVCLITINDEQAVLQSLYVKAHPHNPLNVEYVELRGISLKTNEVITERVKR